MTATLHQFPTSKRLRTVSLTHLDGSLLAKGVFPPGQASRVWMWIEDQIGTLTGWNAPDATMVAGIVSVADDDVIRVDGFPVARVVL